MWYFVGTFLKVREFKSLCGGFYFVSGQLLALANSKAGILDQEPKNPLSSGYEAEQRP